MKLSTIRKRSAATAVFLSVALFGAACASGDDAESVGQEATEATDDTTAGDESTETATDGASEDSTSAEGEAGSKSGRVGAKYAANVFTLVGTDETEDGKITAITDGSVEVRTSNTVSYDGEVLAFTDEKVQEALGEEQYEQLLPDFEEEQVLLVSNLSVE